MALARKVAFAAIACGLACGTSTTLPRDRPVAGETLALTAEIRAFVPQAMHDNAGPEGAAVYDASELVVIEPAERRGTALRVYHDAGLPADSPWRRVGQRLRMRLPKTMLEPGNQIFAGAVRDLQML